MKNYRLLFILMMMLAAMLIVGPGVAGAQQVPDYCFPTCSTTDGRLLSVAGGTALATLSDEDVLLRIRVNGSQPGFEFAVFDGDSSSGTTGTWDSAPSGELQGSPLIFTLFADPIGDGTGTIELNSWVGDTMPDNAWHFIPISNDPQALSASGDYYYWLRVSITDQTSNTWSNFKMGIVNASMVFGIPQAELSAPPTFSFATPQIDGTEGFILYPNAGSGDLETTTYNGTWDVYFYVPPEEGLSFPTHISIHDGDFDRGKYDNTDLDTDDPDTEGIPPWSNSPYANPEGVPNIVSCNGVASLTGCPADDTSTSILVRSPSVEYSIIHVASGKTWLNTNPSGDREWEQFRIETDPSIPADHYETILEPGIYRVHLEGVDINNLNAWRFRYDVLGVAPYRVGDFVWYDKNADGVQDADEPAIRGVVVELLDSNGTMLETTTTDSNGLYSFFVFPGTYTTRIKPENFEPGGALQTLTPTVDYTADGVNDNERTQELFDADVLTYDYGYTDGGIIGNYVWVDENNDSRQDPGEAGLANVIVGLYNDQGNLVDSQQTDTQGGYLFTGVFPGSYTVTVDETTLPAGMTQTNNPVLPGADLGNQSQPYSVTIGAGEENLTADFGFNYNTDDEVNGNQGPGAIGDRIWVDADGDGVQDPNELGVSGVVVNLYTDDDGQGDLDGVYDTLLGSATTDVTGYYIFDDLTPGAYVVEVDNGNFGTDAPLYQWVQTGDPDEFGQLANSPDNRTTAPVIIAPGDVFLNADFGYEPPAGSTGGLVGDLVWLDIDASGTPPPPDAGEDGIAGVSIVVVKDENGNGAWDVGEPILATDKTDNQGLYEFNGLPLNDGSGAAAYIVAINDTDTVLTGMIPTYDADGVTTPNVSAVVLSPTAPVNEDQDFSYTLIGQQMGQGLIGDTIYLDANNDGQPNPGEGIEGVVVHIYDGSNNLLTSVVTNENGLYHAVRLDPDGTYNVVVDETTLPPGLINTVDPDGGNDGQSETTLFSLSPIDLEQDFGYRVDPAAAEGSIGNLVWNDINANGLVDTDEAGLEGVTLNLYWDVDGNGVLDPADPKISSTSSGAGGIYDFTGLPVDDGNGNPVHYIVDVTDVDGVLFGYWHSIGADQGADNNSKADPFAEALSAAQPDSVRADFGYFVEGAALGNRVWADDTSDPTNVDGLQDADESGLADVPVTLSIGYADGSTVTVVTTTAGGTGAYAFSNLLLDEDYNGAGAGDPIYTLSVPAMWDGAEASPVGVGGNPFADSDDHSGTIAQPLKGVTNVSSHADPNDDSTVATYDFGYISVNGSIGDTVFYDVDADGIQNGGDTGIGNVTVNLREAGVDGVLGNADDNVSFTPQVTDGNGNYDFTGLPAGFYQVDVDETTLPTGYLLTTNNDPLDVVLSANQDYDDADFGYTELGSISGSTTVDITGDGQGDTALPNVELTLLDSTDNVIATTTSGSDGSYAFNGLNPGDYTVVETHPNGYGSVIDQDMDTTHFGDPDLQDSDTTVDDAIGVNLKGGEADVGNNFVEELFFDPLPQIDIRKQVEGPDTRTFPPGANVPFEITVTNTGNEDLTNVAVTDAEAPQCDFTIGDLAAGESYTYTCNVTLDTSGNTVSKMFLDDFNPAYSYTGNDGDDAFSGPWIEDDPQGGGPSSGRVVVGSNQKMWLNNYNYPGGTSYKPSARREVDLSGADQATLSFDWITHSGVDSNDGVTLEISSDGGATYTALQTFYGVNTAGSHETFDISAHISANTVVRYRVTNYYGGSGETFKVDNFKIEATGSSEPEGFENIACAVGTGSAGTVNDCDPSTVVVGSVELGSISGWTGLDTDGDGYGDTNLPGVELKLLDSDDAEIKTTTSGSNGGYSFAGLLPGDYTVVETQPVGYDSVLDEDKDTTHFGDPDPQDSDTTVDNKIGVNLKSGEADVGNNFVESTDCIPCVDGVLNMTLKLDYRTSSGDSDERIRVRAGSALNGEVLYDTWSDDVSGGLPVGSIFSFNVPASATQIIVTVQGNSHPSEYIKATFSTECDLVIGSTSGNSYIKFKVNDAQFDGELDCDNPSSPTGVVEVRVSKSSDDAEENNSGGGMYLNSSDLELVNDGSKNQTVGIRFQNVAVPQGATITNAYIEFETDETNSGSTSLTIRGQAADNPGTFTSSSYNISNRSVTSASVAQANVPAWNTVSEKHQTPDLSAIVQEIVERGGWSNGNSMVFVISGSGERTAEAYDGESANAPLLHIEYSDSTPGQTCGGLVQEAENATLSGAFVIGFDSMASGGKYVYAPEGTGSYYGNVPTSDRMDFCVDVQTAGTYELRGWVMGQDGGSDSFYVQIDGQPVPATAWHTGSDVDYVEKASPLSVTLPAGQHTVTFFVREDGTRLDKMSLSLTSSDGASFSDNLLSNGGFEDGTNGWWKSDGYNALTSDNTAGNYAIKINKTASRGMTSGVPASEGDVFKVSAMAKVTGDGWANVSIDFKDANWNSLASKRASVTNTTYQLKETGELTAPAGTAHAEVVLWVGGATYNSYLYVDEVSLQKKQ